MGSKIDRPANHKEAKSAGCQSWKPADKPHGTNYARMLGGKLQGSNMCRRKSKQTGRQATAKPNQLEEFTANGKQAMVNKISWREYKIKPVGRPQGKAPLSKGPEDLRNHTTRRCSCAPALTDVSHLRPYEMPYGPMWIIYGPHFLKAHELLWFILGPRLLVTLKARHSDRKN